MAIWLVVLLLECSLVQLFQAEGADEVFGMKFTEHGCNATTSNGLVTASTKRTSLGMIMGLTIRHAFMIKEASTIKWCLTIPTDKALWMPLSIQCRNVILHDGPIAATTLGSKHLKIVSLAVGFSIFFMETFFPKLVTTLSTEKVFWMPGLVQGRHTFIKDGTITVGTSWRKQVVIITLTIGLSITFKKVLGT